MDRAMKIATTIWTGGNPIERHILIRVLHRLGAKLDEPFWALFKGWLEECDDPKLRDEIAERLVGSMVYSDETVAAFQVGSRIDHIYLLPVIALSASLVTLVGMFHGAQRRDLVRDVIVYAMTRAVLIAFVMGTLFFILAPSFLGAFTDSEVIARTGVGYLRIGVFSYPFIAIVMLTGRVLQGMGNGTPVFVLSLLRVVLISGPLAYIFVLKMGKPVTWVWIAMLIGMVVTAILAFVWLKHALAHENTIPETSDAAASGL